MRDRISLLALAIVIPTACQAQAPARPAAEKLTVPFDGERIHSNPREPYWDLYQRLRARAAAEARDSRHEAVVSMTPAGRDGEQNLIMAITPAKGVFYYARNALDGPGEAVRPRSQVEVCRFTIHWGTLPKGNYAPGLIWADPFFPGLDCKARSGPDLGVVAQWHRDSAGADYKVVASGIGAGLKGAVVFESWPGLRHRPAQPIDGGRAAAAVAGGGDRIVRAIPIFDDGSFFAETASGRTFAGFFGTVGAGGETTCLVEGLRWADLASADRARRSAADELCRRLYSEYAKGLWKPGERGPHVVKSPKR